MLESIPLQQDSQPVFFLKKKKKSSSTLLVPRKEGLAAKRRGWRQLIIRRFITPVRGFSLLSRQIAPRGGGPATTHLCPAGL